ncbi:uncharacterized protein LOC105212149 isoform X6 [Zeugodacus cucurbitae]|uniref:uncharacterized protein LOC105212149 isoform X6 n=1 Tax=Zeugodacus cucurbitae TaxID=28588 RepID=UPI0010A7474D|nr:uncharacterized protein LOC105212149 isoform X6 [Zeugodacus cucurbitae]
MPNYRQKNKRNKNKNRQKNQQQQQQQNKNQNQQQPEIQQTHQNRQPNDNKDNQSQGHSRREQSNQQQQRQQHPKTPPKSPKSPTPTATQHTPPADEPRTATSPQQQQPASSEDAREVDSNVPAAALNQCHNLNSNEPTTRDSHQTFTTAVEREECNRVEDADAQLSKLDNTEAATHSDTAYLNSATVVGVERDAVYRSTMGNKDSKTYITSSNDVATTARTETVTTSTDLCGISRPDRTIAGARELDELHTVMPKTQMAKVIVHRIVRETSTEGGDNEQRRNGDIDKVEQVVNVGASMTSGTTGESKVEVMNEPKIQATSSDGQIEESELHEQLQSTVKEGNEVGSKVIVHKIEQEPGEEPKAELTKVEPKVIVHEIKQVEDDLTVSQESEALTAQTTDQTSQINANVIVHKIAQSTDGNAVASRIQDNGAEKPTVSPPTNAACVSPTGMPEQNDDAKVIIHHIQLESTSPINYRVDSPDTDSPTTQLCRSKRQQLLNKSIVQIQELSDESSSEYNDNPPVISEAESETESMAGACALDYAQAVRTLSPDSDDNFEILRKPPTIPSQEQQDLKQRRAQKRVALETHFLPQLLSPRYLDSIIEENSDMSDARSDCSENPLMTTQSGDDLHDASASKVRKANEVFPRSNLDFTRRHAKKPLGALPKKPLPIREEPVAMVVAAKLIDNALTPAQECCTRLSSEHTPESEAAEVIYLSSSASSSLSDLMELDTEGDGDDECGNSSRSTIDLDTDAREIITRPDSEECATTASDSRESTPVNQASTSLSENNETQKFHANNNNNESGSVEQITATAAAAAVNGTNIDTAKITNPIEQRIFENLKSLQLLAEPSGERTLSNGSGEIKTSTTTRVSKRTTTTISETERSSETTTERCEYLRSSNSSANGSGSSSLTSSTDAKYPPAIIATSDSLNVDPAVLLENIELEMNSVRDILNSHTIETTETTATTCGNQHVSDTRTTCELKNIDNFNSAKNSSLSPPPIPPPPTSASASDFHSDFTGFQTQPIQPPPVPARATQDTGTLNSASTLTTTTEQKCAQSETTNTLSPNTHNALTSLSLLARQESAESHCSDSTQHSQCTAINVGSRPSTDHELTPPLTATSPISDASQQQQQRQHTTEWKYGETSESDANSCDLELPNAQQKDASIKKLRLLCTETLASMPYGEQVLVELATVAQNIGELQAKPPTQVQPEKISPLSQGKTGEPNMPYPLPQLPHISELQLSIADERSAPTTHSEPKRGAQVSHTPTTHIVPITQLGDPVGAPRDLTAASAKLLHSPPPPPVPAPPARYSDAPWLGLPTAADPNVLVCLSPAQQQQLTGNNTQSASQTGGAQQTTPQPDQLLDAHQKFLERRGYHEYTDEQVKSLNAEMQQEEQQILKTAAYMKKLRKSLTPPPPPVPPPPVPAKNAETAAKAQNQARTAAAASTSYVSSGHSQRVYDVIQDRNANEQIAGTFANGEQQQQQHQANQSEQKRLLTLIQQHADAPADAFAVSVDGSSSATSSAHQQTSSLENNSRQTSAAAVAAATAAAQGGAPTFAGKQTTDTRQYSNANASESTSISRVSDLYAANNYTKNSFPTTTTASTSSVNMQGVESELAKMFPSMGSSDIFDSNRKRFSNIESSTTAKDGTYCAQLQSTLPKRYSNIETHSYEAKKRMENGQVIYDYSNSRHERQSDGDKSLENASTPSLLHFPVREPSKESLQYPVAGDGVSNRSGNSEIMSAIKLNTTENAKTTTQETKLETKEQSNGINMTNFAHPGATSTATATSTTATPQHNPTDRTFGTAATTATTETTIKEEHIKNSQEFGSGTAQPQASSGGGVSGSAYEEFRQRAKAAAFGGETPATAPPLGESNSKHSAFNFQHDKLFKDFDALSQQLHMELEEGKAQRQQREKSASLFDLNRTQWNFKDHFDELKQQRHEHMQELEREIERSMRSRQLKGWANGGAPNTANATPAGRTYEIPIQIEQNNGNYSNGYARKADRSSAPRELTQPRSYNIPIVLENGDAPAVPPPPTADYDTVDDASRFRRAESMFNLSNDTRRTQTQSQQTYATYERPKSAAADDWARYASDFGSSENITRPFAREVEICYQRQRPRTIRAPRLSASTNDLSSYTHSYDNYNAYNARRTQAPMLQPVSQQQRPHHGSCYSVLERNPNPTYISTTTRRGVSPAPVSPNPQAAAAQEPLYSPHAPERQRRASLPREIQEQQLKYISSKEEELRMEFERLQNERRRLMDELNTPTTPTLQMPQHPMRDIYRPVPKLPTLTEDEVFRQQMAEEWLSKVAEREERRLHKIIKISKVNETQQGQQPPVPPHPKTDISDEFLKRVQERRTKLAMPADSDWESGAESQPVKAGHASESDAEVPPVKVIEGKSETDLRQLPRHLREFARFSNHNEEKIDGGHRVVHQEEERRQEANGNSMSSALKKSSVVKTVKIARQPEIVTNISQRVAPPVSVQQQQQHQNTQQQQGHSRTTSGGETAVTRRSHISTATSSSRSSYETHAKLQQRSILSGGDVGAFGGIVSGGHQQQQPHSQLRHHNHHQPHQQHQHHHHHHQHSHSHSHKASSSSSRPPAPHVRTCKKTRFLLEPNRRSWSESDLLKEIDNELKLAKGFLYANEPATKGSMFVPKFKATAPSGSGIWTPGTQTPNTSFTNLNDIHPKVSTPTPPPPPLPAQGAGQPVWTPQPSPSSGRKEFRPVRFESPTLPRRYVLPQSNDAGTPQVPPPWRQSTTTTDGDSSYAAPSPRSAYSYTNLSTPTTTIGSAGSTNYCDSIPSESSLLNHVGTGPSQSVADKIKTFERSASTSALYSPAARRRHDTAQPFYKPNEVIFKVKHEYMSEPETEHDHPRKMAQLGRRQVDGIGPVTNDGMPIILRSEVKEPHQHEWYKRLYQTIHKQKSGDDYVIRYKCQRARPQLKSTGYQSEPEPNYDSDYSTVKYRTLDRRRLQSVSSATNVANRHTNTYQDDKLYGTMPNPIKSESNTYKNQPGRIEDYVTGRSSVSEKERKEHLEQTKLSPHYTEGNLSRALAKESGYASDSNLVFRKRDVPQASPLSPVEQKQAYKSVQAGGEPPLFGFRKPAPERPKEYLDYTQISPTLTRIRVISTATASGNNNLKTSQVTHQQEPPQQFRHSKVHHQAKMFAPSFIPLGGKRATSASGASPPQPPNRKSSCQKVTAKSSPARPPKPTPNIPKRHEQCFQSPEETVLGANKYATITLRKHGRVNGAICRSKSAGAVSTLLASTKSGADTPAPPRALSICRDDTNVPDGMRIKRVQQHTRFHSISPTRSQTRVATLRQSSRSPVAFGRSISKERTFAEEKKRLENTLPTALTNFEASTNILRDPSLKSPQEVKQAVRSYATCVAHLRSKSMPRLREEVKKAEQSSVSTTVRHSMCFPQAKIFDCAKAMRKSLTRSKSPRPKNVSTISLTRTDSTFSIDSTTPKNVSRTNLVVSKRVAAPKSKTESKTIKAKPVTQQNGKRISASTKGNTIPKALKTRSSLKTQTSPTVISYKRAEGTHTIPRTGYQSISLHQSRSLSPKRYYHLEEYNARLDDYDVVDRSYVDDLLWQYERSTPKHYPAPAVPVESTARDIARPESPTPSLKHRKFSPTREVRVPQEPRSLQVSYSKTESPRTDVELVQTAISTERTSRFSPTREVRMPNLPPSLQPTMQRSKSSRTVRDIARPESPAFAENSRRFSPTREVRVPQPPQSLPPPLPPVSSSHTMRDQVHTQSSSKETSAPPRKFSPTREIRVPQQQSARSVRSPSRRRIDTYRASTTKSSDKYDAGKVLRASSLSSADDRSKRGLYLCGDLAHSATSLEHYERHSPTCRYRNNSERFTELNRFYSTLERVGQLERATSLSSFKPIRRDGEPLDFDEWRKIRHHERAEKELNYLVGKLKHEQRTKDFVFRPKDVEDVKWRQETDFGLHSKDKSVEDLRYSFEQKNIFADYEQKLRQEFDGSREIVRPYWRRNTVADLASSLEGKIQPDSVLDHMTASAEPEELAKCQLSSRLVSTLSKDQILKITQQLNEIYANNTQASTEDYVITVDADAKRRAALPGALKVRCNSTLTKEELLKPTISKKLAKDTTTSKEHTKGKTTKESTSMETTAKTPRSSSPVYLARETRGAVAAKNAEVFMPKPPPIPEQPKSGNLDRKTAEQRQHAKLATDETEPFKSHVHYEQLKEDLENYKQCELTPSGKEPKEKITQKIQYFEERQYDEPPKTIYHAREDSSPDEAEVMKVIEENMKTRARKGTPTPAQQHHKELSHSLTDLKDIFGERHTARVNFHMHSPPERPPDVGSVSQPMSPVRDCMEVTEDAWYDLGELTPNSSVEQLDAHYRSRSISPVSQASSSYLCRVHTGDVRKMTERFESFGEHDDSRCHFFGVSTLRKVRSDPELKQFNEGSKDALKMETPNEECGDVQALAHKFEQRSQSMRVGTGCGRGRTPYRRVISPIGVRDRLMPHIDIISKTAALKENKHASAPRHLVKTSPERSFVVERIRSQYERSLSPPTNVFKSSSSPDIPQAAAISPHLSADWIAHKYPSPTQNAYKGNGTAKPIRKERTSVRIAKILRRLPPRSSSASPPRPPKTRQNGRDTSFRRMRHGDIFANQQFDPKKHQPKARYVPDGAEANERKRATSHPRCGGSCEILKSAMAVSFQESPNRYLESDVNIHFKTPIRHEYKQAMSDEDLAQRQAEQMQKLYQEERRRKYLQELQDMNARRHTDNFTPTQKSPIPLNRYDDFQSDLAPKSPNAITTRTPARALYNFQGQNARELTFKKGDIIYIRRQIDRNWYEGEFNAMIGLLPVSYVEVVNKETARQQPKKPSEGQARAKYNFQAQSGIELSLNKGELVTLTRRVDDNWFEGKIANRKGIFPVSYVEVLTDIGAEDIAARTVISEHASVTNLRPSLDTLRTNINNEFNLITKNGHQPPNGILKETKHHNNKIDALHVDTHSEPLVYRALYKYRPQNSDEMELLEGDIVHVLEICDDGWFVGTSQRTGCFGTFPGNYVERVR